MSNCEVKRWYSVGSYLMSSPRKRIRARSDGGGEGVMAMGMVRSELEDGVEGVLM